MNFYRTGKVIGVTANEAFNLESSQFKHKAIMIPNASFTGTLSLYCIFYDASRQNTMGVTLAGQAFNTGQYPYIIPGILRSVTPNLSGRLVLLS